MSRILDERDKQKLEKNMNEIEADINSRFDTKLNAHKNNTYNPHGVTKAQLGLGNVNNTSDLNKPISTATQAALNLKVDKDGDKQLSENDLTDALKDNYDAAYNHSTVAHAPSEAEQNVQPNWTETDISSDAYIQNKPESMKNPHSLILSGAVNATYDGSTAITVEIPVYDGITSLSMRVNDGWLQYSSDNGEWTNLILTTDLFASGGAGSLNVTDEGVLYFG